MPDRDQRRGTGRRSYDPNIADISERLDILEEFNLPQRMDLLERQIAPVEDLDRTVFGRNETDDTSLVNQMRRQNQLLNRIHWTLVTACLSLVATVAGSHLLN